MSFGYTIFDGIITICIAFLLFYNSAKLVKHNTRFLIGLSPPDEFYDDVEKIVLEFDEVKGVHDMVATYLGEDKIHLDMHITVDGKMSVNEADELSEKIENKLKKRMPQIKHVIVHVCPHHGKRRKLYS